MADGVDRLHELRLVRRVRPVGQRRRRRRDDHHHDDHAQRSPCRAPRPRPRRPPTTSRPPARAHDTAASHLAATGHGERLAVDGDVADPAGRHPHRPRRVRATRRRHPGRRAGDGPARCAGIGHVGGAQPHRRRTARSRLPVGLPVCERPVGHVGGQLRARPDDREHHHRHARRGRPGLRVDARGQRRARRHQRLAGAVGRVATATDRTDPRGRHPLGSGRHRTAGRRRDPGARPAPVGRNRGHGRGA